MTAFECLQEVLQSANLGIASLFQPTDPAIEFIWHVNLKGPIWTERGINAKTTIRIFLRRVDLIVMAKVVARIVGGTRQADAEFAQDAASAKLFVS